MAFDLDVLGFEDDSPVQFSAVDVDGAVPGTEVVVKVFATIERGWHIYGFEMNPDEGIPTTLVLAGSGDLELHHDIREQTAHQRDDAILGLVHEHEGKVQFEVPLKVPEGAEAGPRKILIDISYQACDCQAMSFHLRWPRSRLWSRWGPRVPPKRVQQRKKSPLR